jgi:hypothetical protein
LAGVAMALAINIAAMKIHLVILAMVIIAPKLIVYSVREIARATSLFYSLAHN